MSKIVLKLAGKAEHLTVQWRPRCCPAPAPTLGVQEALNLPYRGSDNEAKNNGIR